MSSTQKRMASPSSLFPRRISPTPSASLGLSIVSSSLPDGTNFNKTAKVAPTEVVARSGYGFCGESSERIPIDSALQRKQNKSSHLSGDRSHIRPAIKVGNVRLRTKMKNIPEVLFQKQIELASAKRDVDALRIVAPLLNDAKDRISEAVDSFRTHSSWSMHCRDAAECFFANCLRSLWWLKAQRLAWRPR